jgi:hypothetical protein
MEIEEGRAAPADAGRRTAPYDRVAELRPATPEAEPPESRSAVAHAPWIRNINDYERRETTIVEGLRYG